MNFQKPRLRFIFAMPRLFAIFFVAAFLFGVAIFQYTMIAQAIIENALAINPSSIDFGISSSQQFQQENFSINLSSSFLSQSNTHSVNYQIVKKQNCKTWDVYGTCTEYYPDLCPYLNYSPSPLETSEIWMNLDKSTGDTSDQWILSLNTPSQNQTYKCDLWVEVSSIASNPFSKIFAYFPIQKVSSYEARIINVTANPVIIIPSPVMPPPPTPAPPENALWVQLSASSPDQSSIDYGIVFPTDIREKSIFTSMTNYFVSNTNATRIGYSITQKPKCKNFADNGSCAQYYPDLCPYLSETPTPLGLLSPADDIGISSPHEIKPYPVAIGILTKDAEHDMDRMDYWVVGLKTPCFEDNCPRDYNPKEFGVPLPSSLKGQTFSCELQVQTVTINDKPVTDSPDFQSHENHIVSITANLTPLSLEQLAAYPIPAIVFPLTKEAARTIINIHEKYLGVFMIKTGIGLGICALGGPAGLGACVAGVAVGYVTDKFLLSTLDLISKDPPRQDFNIVVKIKPIEAMKPFDNSLFVKANANYTNTIAEQNEIYRAILITFERLQGAIIANDGHYMLLQSKALSKFFKSLEQNQKELKKSLELLQKTSSSIWSDNLKKEILRFAAEGLTPEERQLLQEAGLSTEEIMSIEENFKSIPQTENFDSLTQEGIRAQINFIDEMQPKLKIISSVIENTITDLKKTVRESGDESDSDELDDEIKQTGDETGDSL